jgi:predicted O-methyltransferase YrrM
LEGKPPTKNKLVKFIRYVLSKEYRMDVRAGNFYENLDYIDIIKKLFAKFNLNFDKVDLNKGFSTDPEIIRKFSTAKVDLLYIDGDHSYEGALSDIINYSERINKGGYLVMDDASFYLPGSVFWKGYKSVADACEAIDKNTFVNVLNVAHNRVYQRI